MHCLLYFDTVDTATIFVLNENCFFEKYSLNKIKNCGRLHFLKTLSTGYSYLFFIPKAAAKHSGAIGPAIGGGIGSAVIVIVVVVIIVVIIRR